jgi:REP element-mobilizing transposase RayT
LETPPTDEPARGSRQLRKGRVSLPGTFYFVTSCCEGKRRLFDDADNAQVIFDCLDWLAAHELLDLHFAVVMPDHIHLVFELPEARELSAVMKSFKQFTSRTIGKRTGLPGVVWQEGYYDHAIRRTESLADIIKYCWFNPVRAGLVKDPSEYPWWRSKCKLV